MITKTQAEQIAERTKDAYSFRRYSKSGWRESARMLARRRYNEIEIEEILRSKMTRWAGDFSDKKYRCVTSKDLEKFLDNYGPSLARDVAQMVAETRS